MKLPLAPTAIGLLVGIILLFILQPYLDDTFGIALLFVICILVANSMSWVGRALFGRKRSSEKRSNS